MNTAEQIYEKAQSLNQPAQKALLQIVESAEAALHTRRAGEIRGARHERQRRRGDGCGFEIMKRKRKKMR